MKNVSVKKQITLKDMEALTEKLKTSFKKPQVLLLEGPPGAGKTTFVRFLLKQINKKSSESLPGSGSGEAASPAFSVQHSYETALGCIRHIDLYRLKNDADLESTGFWDIFSEPEKTYLIIMEWANRLNSSCLPPGWNYMKMVFSFTESKDTRDIRICRLDFPV